MVPLLDMLNIRKSTASSARLKIMHLYCIRSTFAGQDGPALHLLMGAFSCVVAGRISLVEMH